MNIFALIGIALICFAALQILGKDSKIPGALIAACGAVTLTAPAILSLSGLLKEITEFTEKYEFIGGEYLLKGLAIGLCCEFTSDVLRDSGNAQTANALDFACRIAIISLCLPLWRTVFDLFGGMFA